MKRFAVVFLLAFLPGVALAGDMVTPAQGFAVTSPALDALLGATPGGVAVRGASGWVNTGSGVSGQALTSQGAGVAPIWSSITAATSSGWDVVLGNKATTSGHNPQITTGDLLQFGGATASFTALKPNGTTLKLRLADDSGDGLFTAGYGIFNGNGTNQSVYLAQPTATSGLPSSVGGSIVLSRPSDGSGISWAAMCGQGAGVDVQSICQYAQGGVLGGSSVAGARMRLGGDAGVMISNGQTLANFFGTAHPNATWYFSGDNVSFSGASGTVVGWSAGADAVAALNVGLSSGGAAIVKVGNGTANDSSGTLVATTLTGTLSTAAQPNVTSLGTLTSLTMGGQLSMGANAIQFTDATILRDAANVLAQRNATSAQAARFYNTFTSATSFERLNLDWQTTANVMQVYNSVGSAGGTPRQLVLGAYSLGSDLAAPTTLLKGTNAFGNASSNTTGGVLAIGNGIGRRLYQVLDYTQLALKTVTVTVNGSATVLTEGTNWTAATSNNATATSLATAISTVSGVTGTAASANAYLTPAATTYTLTIATNAAAGGMTAVSGSDGNLLITNNIVTSSGATFGSSINVPSAGQIYWASSTSLAAPSDGVLTLYNFANTAFTRVNFGGTSASFVSLQSSGTTLTVGTADGGTSAGALTVSGVCQATNFSAGANNQYQISGRSRWGSTADGLVQFFNSAGTGFTSLELGALTPTGTDTAAQTPIILVGAGTGAGANGTLRLQAAPAISGGGSSSAVNAQTTLLTLAAVQNNLASAAFSNGALCEVANVTFGDGAQAGTGSFCALRVAPTLNYTNATRAQNFTALLIQQTNTSAPTGTLNLIDAQVGGVSKFTVNSLGGLALSSTLTGSVGINLGSGTLVLNSGGGGKINNYAGVATAGWGVPAIYGSGRATAQTAANASVATYTCGAADGSFEVSANLNVTMSTTFSINVQVTYTDETNTAQTITMPMAQTTGTFLTAITNVQGAAPYEGPSLHIRCKASTAITIKTAGTFTSVTYNVEGSIRQIS